MGVAAREVVLFILGTVLVVAMVIAYGVTVGSALALDRRFVSARLEEVSTSTGGGHSGHVVGDEVDVIVEFANRSTLPIFNLSADPYAPDQLGLEGELDVPLLGRRRRVGCQATVNASGSGRWMLQGFDVTLGDPFGLVRVSDYIPCNFAFEFYPRVGRLDRTQKSRRLLRRPEEREGRRQRAEMTTGTVIRELRDYQSGDPLRHVAWKATARKRKLISRDFEDEITAGTTLLLDISGSMRGGAWKGQKLEHAVELAAGIADELITSRNQVGMISFDEKVYGYIPPGSSQSHYRRILHHLLGLNSIVDPDLTELDDGELKELLVDYLLVQERLDFRSGGERQVKDELLDRWIRSRLEEERRRYHSPVLREGIVGSGLSAVREFVQLRGLPVPYRVESRLGPKGRGMAQALERLVHDAPAPQFVVVISDLCGVSNFDVLDRGLALARHEGHKIRFLVPFTPSYHQEPEESSEKHDILLELFTASEREERMRGVEFLKEKGVDVQFIGQQARQERP